MSDDGVRRILERAEAPLAPAPEYAAELLQELNAELGFTRDLVPRRRYRPRARSRRRQRYWLLLAAILATAAIGIVAGTGALRRAPAPPPALFAPIRTFSWSSIGVTVPLDMAAGPDGMLYVLDVKPSVTVIDPADGRVVRTWGRQGAGPGDFDLTLPNDPGNPGRGSIDVAPGGRVFVADSTNHRVQVFEPDGRFVTQFGQPGTADGQFGQLDELVVGDDGSVYVLDLTVNRFTKMSEDGHVLWRSVASGLEPREGHWIHGLTARSDGTIIATCETCNQFLLFDQRAGRLIRRVDPIGFGGPFSGPIELDPSGNTVIEMYTTESFHVFDHEGRLLASMDITGNRKRADSAGKAISYGDWYFPTPVFLPDGRAFTFAAAGLVELREALP